MEDDFPDLSTLEAALIIHRREMASLRKMTDAQFAIFRTNFTIGQLEMSRTEAMATLANMIATNLRMQEMVKK